MCFICFLWPGVQDVLACGLTAAACPEPTCSAAVGNKTASCHSLKLLLKVCCQVNSTASTELRRENEDQLAMLCKQCLPEHCSPCQPATAPKCSKMVKVCQAKPLHQVAVVQACANMRFAAKKGSLNKPEGMSIYTGTEGQGHNQHRTKRLTHLLFLFLM